MIVETNNTMFAKIKEVSANNNMVTISIIIIKK